MINDIIRAYSSNLLTQVEAKSYIQRTIEAQIEEIKSSAEEASARVSQIISSFEDTGCGCNCLSEDIGEAPITAREEKAIADKEALREQVAQIIKIFEL